jgi:uncharacterized protein YndB with AHSA1/START domain
MVHRTGTTSGTVPAPPDAVFAAVTDIDRLPEWNETIQRVTERPEVLGEGAEWVVAVKPPGMPEWLSRATVVELDRPARRFRYRTCTEDGNPSWTTWEWQARPTEDGTAVTVGWEIHPTTFGRRVLFSRIRNRALHKEVQASIEALDTMVATDAG